MSQGTLFDASVYIQRAYDQLVLAYDQAELEQLRSLKQQTLRTYIALQDMLVDDMPPSQPLELEAEVDVPF